MSLALLIAYLAAESANGTVRRVLDGELDSLLLCATAVPLVLIGYIPTAQLYLARWTRRHVETLAPLLRERSRSGCMPSSRASRRACSAPRAFSRPS